MKSNQPKTCIAYARVSSQKQSHNGESPQDQARAFRQYIKQREWELLPGGEVSIEVASGSTSNRPVYQALLQYIKKNPNKVGYFLIRYIDRFSRGGAGNYAEMKQELADHGVELIDTGGIIQPEKNMPELAELGFEYSWSKQSSSQMTEMLLATQAEQERKKILGRTIPKQIQYTQQGWQIGRPIDGFINKQIEVGGKLRYILAPDPERAHFFITIFEMRAACKYTDKEIVDHINNLGFLTKKTKRWDKSHTKIKGHGGGIPLSVKQLQRIVKNTMYAGIRSEKWTHHKPIKVNWAGLVSIEMFNQANGGKIFIQKLPNEKYQILHDHKPEKKVYRRLKYNPDYPFKCFKCPTCGKRLKGSASTGKSGKRFPAYHCERGHKSFRVPAKELEKTVEDFLNNLEYSPEFLDAFEEILIRKFRERQKSITEQSAQVSQNLANLKSLQSQAVDQLLQTSNPTTKKLIEERIEKLEADIERTKTQRFVSELREEQIKEFVTYAKKIVEHPQKVLIDKDNPLRQEKLMTLLFDEMPSYDQLVSGTPKLSFVFNTLSQIQGSKNSTERQLG